MVPMKMNNMIAAMALALSATPTAVAQTTIAQSAGWAVVRTSDECVAARGTDDSIWGLSLFSGDRHAVFFTTKRSGEVPKIIVASMSAMDVPFSKDRFEKTARFALVETRGLEHTYKTLITRADADELMRRRFVSFAQLLTAGKSIDTFERIGAAHQSGAPAEIQNVWRRCGASL